MPADIAARYPDYWLSDEEEGGKNQFEESLLTNQLKKLGITKKHFYSKKHIFISIGHFLSA